MNLFAASALLFIAWLMPAGMVALALLASPHFRNQRAHAALVVAACVVGWGLLVVMGMPADEAIRSYYGLDEVGQVGCSDYLGCSPAYSDQGGLYVIPFFLSAAATVIASMAACHLFAPTKLAE